MDTTTTSNIQSLLSTLWTTLYGTASQSQTGVQASVVLGYSGSTLAFFFSIAGAYIAGSKLMSSTEYGFFSFLDDFENDGNYINMLDDQTNGPEFHKFLEDFGWYQLLLLLCSFWHVLFIIAMGTTQAIVIYFRIKLLDDASSTDIDINVGWLLLLMGLLYGATNYMAAIGLQVNNDTILQMTGFMPKSSSESSSTKSVFSSADGDVTTITQVSEEVETKKNFFAMNEIMSLWADLFFFQQTLQMSLPFLYILLLETAVVMVFVATVFNYF